MSILLGVFLGASVLIVVFASVFSDVKTWTAIGYMTGSLRKLPLAERQRDWRQTAIILLVVGGYFALLIVHPLGLRNTFIWFLIVPFLIATPLGVLVTGIIAWRRPRHEPAQSSKPRPAGANDKPG